MAVSGRWGSSVGAYQTHGIGPAGCTSEGHDHERSVARWLSPLGALKLALLGWTLRATRAACARVAAALAAGGAVVYDASS